MTSYLLIIRLIKGTERNFTAAVSIFSLRSVMTIIRVLILLLTISDTLILNAASQIRTKPKYRFEVDLGYGFPEAIGIKFKYGNKIQAGIVQSLDSRGLGPTALELYYHIGKKPRLLDQSPWYISGGLAGYLIDVNYVKEYNYLIYPRVGRSFYFSRNTGINLDVGPGFPLGRNNSSKNTIAPVLFTGSLTIFIRF
ncbi:MAG: hypothetical protein H6Q23_1066 [Bacteroidetes bacterium]|nr:hypothetical protein [Bacteroidota bacterium]